MAEALLITRQDVVKFTAMNGNVDTDNFIQYVKIAQDIHIQNFLGTDLLQKLQAEIILATSGIPTAITVSNQGTGYTTGTAVNTTSATGTGLKLNITASGGLISGAALKGAQRFGQELGSQEYMNAFNRYQTNRANQLQPLQSLMGTSQTAANTLGTAAGNYAQGAGEAYMGAGNARASGYMGQANALSNALGQGINIYQGQQFLNNMRFRPGGSNYGGGSSVSYLPDDRDIGGGGYNPIFGQMGG